MEQTPYQQDVLNKACDSILQGADTFKNAMELLYSAMDIFRTCVIAFDNSGGFKGMVR